MIFPCLVSYLYQLIGLVLLYVDLELFQPLTLTPYIRYLLVANRPLESGRQSEPKLI